MPLMCPNGHESASSDFCDVCGLQMSGTATALSAPEAAAPAVAEPDGPDACPVCGEPRTGRFCEGCSYDFVSGVGGDPQPAAWTAVIRADHDYYQLVLDQGEPEDGVIPFPDDLPERTVSLVGTEIRIGRRSHSRGETPEIDLAGPPLDPGVSHRHAVLVAVPDGWAVKDTGSTNGTTINDNDDPITPDVVVPLTDGDRVHVGAWTTITLRHNPGSAR
ncbi:MAG TPA: FHA domain-containing protein [Pseudonocardiaceae bacterium]